MREPERQDEGPTDAELVMRRMGPMPYPNPADWEAWKAELNRIAGDCYGASTATEACGEDTWRPYYEEGKSPAAAILSDMEYWGD